MRSQTSGRIFLGGHSYGGRQASMLCAAEPGLVDALLLLSYPLHPPQRPAELRTAHFPALRTPALFVSGVRDGFGSIDELASGVNAHSGPHRTASDPGRGPRAADQEESRHAARADP